MPCSPDAVPVASAVSASSCDGPAKVVAIDGVAIEEASPAGGDAFTPAVCVTAAAAKPVRVGGLIPKSLLTAPPQTPKFALTLRVP